MAQPGDRRELAELERHAHADDRVERAREDRRHPVDAEAARYGGERHGRREGGDRYAGATVTRRRYGCDVPPLLRGRGRVGNRRRRRAGGWHRYYRLAFLAISGLPHPVVRACLGTLGTQPPNVGCGRILISL